MHPGFEHEAFGVYQQMSLSALDLFASVVTTLITSHAGALERLAVHHAGARMRIPLQADPHTLAQGGVHPLPGAVDAPSPQVMVDGLPWRKVVRKQAPGAPATHDVEDGVKDLAQGVYPGTPRGFGGGEMGLYAGPLGIGEVGLVCSSHARYSTELPSQDTFSDSF